MKIAQLKLGRLGRALHCGLSLAPTTHHVWLAGVVWEDNFMKCRESRVIFAQPTPRCAVPYYVAWAVGTHHPPSVLLGWWGRRAILCNMKNQRLFCTANAQVCCALLCGLGCWHPPPTILLGWWGEKVLRQFEARICHLKKLIFDNPPLGLKDKLFSWL